MIYVLTPVGWFFGAGLRIYLAMYRSWLGVKFPGLSGLGDGHSTESLILAQDERWRRA